MKAYRVTWQRMPHCAAIVAAATRGAATYATFLFCRDAQPTRIVDFRTIRAPEYDRFVDQARPGQALGWCDEHTGERTGCCATLADEERARLAAWNRGAPIPGAEHG